MEASKYFFKKHGQMTFGQVLKAQRLGEEWTQADLAERVGVSPVAISQFERGLGHPKPETLQKIADVFGLKIESFLRYIMQDLIGAYGKYDIEIKKVG